MTHITTADSKKKVSERERDKQSDKDFKNLRINDAWIKMKVEAYTLTSGVGNRNYALPGLASALV
jgi:hypothetical protein